MIYYFKCINYRPIAIATAISKIFELVILSKCENYIQSCDNQFGFKKKHSTDLCIFVLKDVLNYFNRMGSPVFTVFIDLKKAYDRVNHSKLFRKLIKRGVPLYIVKFLAYWYSHQQLQVRWGNTCSEAFHVTNGIRQGGLVSAALFSLYIEDLSGQLNGSRVGCRVGSEVICHLAYADDIVLLAPSPKALKVLLKLCDKYASLFDIVYNTDKTLCMIFWPKRWKFIFTPVFKLQGDVLKYVKDFKYLGFIISNDTKDNLEIYKRTGKMYATGNMIIAKFKNCHNLCKTIMFKTYCTNVYACALWANYSVAAYQRMRVAYNNIFRLLLNVRRGPDHSISALFVQHQVNDFESVMRVSVNSLMRRVLDSTNRLVVALRESSARLHSTLWHRWAIVLRRDADQELLV